MNINLTRREISRILAALHKAEEWDECDAQSMTAPGGMTSRGWTREYRRARRSQAANLRLQENLRGMLRAKR